MSLPYMLKGVLDLLVLSVLNTVSKFLKKYPRSQYSSWFCFNETVSVVNIDSKKMLQMFETAFRISEAVRVSCSG